MAKPDPNGIYSFQDWQSWEGTWEWINGKAHDMSPAPTSLHPFVVGELHFSLRAFFRNDACMVFTAPFDVFLARVDSLIRRIMWCSPICRLSVRKSKFPGKDAAALLR